MNENRFGKGFLMGVLTSLVVVVFIGAIATVIGISFFKSNTLDIGREKETAVIESSNQNEAENEKEEKEYNELVEKINEINEIMEAEYYETYDQQEMIDQAIKGYLKGVGDPYTTYYTTEDLKSFQEDSQGSYEGIGVIVGYTEEGNLIEVVAPFIGSPGEIAGLLPGDIIIAVDGEDITQMDLVDAVKLIKGEKGTDVVLTILRKESKDSRAADTMDISVTRDEIIEQSVYHEMLDNNIGYMQITGFKEVTYDQFMEALDDLEDQGQEGMIIDLRNNPGGYLHIVNKMADELLPKGLIVYTEDKNGKQKQYKSDERKKFTKPIVVLVNENSASASEILSGAIKDYEIGTLVGKTTFGKGLVQTTLPLSGNSAIKLTSERYFTPAGNYIHGVGIEPHVEVDLPEEVSNPYRVEREQDTQLDKAIEIMNEKIK